jgi:Animal haem peroxidase
LKGIPQTLPNHHGVPYSLTEEFASVYRLHPLIPDDYVFYNFETGQPTETRAFEDIQGIGTDDAMRRLRLHNVIYSFGISHPGAITLYNYPRSLQRFKRTNGEIIDLSVVDIVRDRRRGVPRFNDFRQKLHRPPIRYWEELSTDQDTIRKIREIYGSIDNVDTMIGLHAEPPPDGFGFSDTAFRIFILMASRRLQSDRFLTVDYRAEVYSPLGLDWIEKNGMTSVILRHCPQLASVLPRTASAFAPFRPVAV